MGLYEQAIEALEALPEAERERVASIILDLAAASHALVVLTEEDLAIAEMRSGAAFRAADPARLKALLASLD
jgi:hypothetical protein